VQPRAPAAVCEQPLEHARGLHVQHQIEWDGFTLHPRLERSLAVVG
jgi:hypothetical protein